MLSSKISCLSTHCAWKLNGFSSNINDVLQFKSDEPVPTIRAPDELLIRVVASSVNPLDIWMSQGYGNEIFEKIDRIKQCKALSTTYDRFPLTLGRDLSGIVVDKGSHVKSVEIGDQVWGAIPPYKQGTHAQYVIATDSEVSLKPNNLEHHEAASMPYVSLTALAALTSSGGLNENNCAGKRVLVLGGSGGVGTIALQLLKNWGAYVATTCSTDAVSWIQEIADVDQIIDYKSNDLTAYSESFDYVFDFAKRSEGSSVDPVAFECLKKNCSSAYVTLSSPLLRTFDEKGFLPGLVCNAVKAGKNAITGLIGGRSIRWAFYKPNLDGLLMLKRLVEEKKIKPTIESTFNFDQLPQAYNKVQEGHLRGKIVIQFE